MPRFKKTNKLLVSIFASLLCLISSVPLLAGHDFTPFTATYTVSRNDSEIGIRTHTLSLQNELYTYEAKMHTTGWASIFRPGEITERSQWRYKNQQVLPINYEYDDSSNEDRHTVLNFDWPNNSVTNHVGNKPWAMNIPNGTQDKFSYMLALMHDLQHGAQNPEYKIADGGRLKTYQFKALGTEVIETPAGKFKALKLQRIRVGKKNRITYLWCLPEKYYLPIKIERHKRGNVYTMELNKLK
ncbi:MAG: DUF3108 domain-containing protein [Sulfuriflexus sp.]|nr:DUF3108 domain-containing protein [Sulfuriflexus sp.]